jgi:WD40 repeat protein
LSLVKATQGKDAAELLRGHTSVLASIANALVAGRRDDAVAEAAGLLVSCVECDVNDDLTNLLVGDCTQIAHDTLRCHDHPANVELVRSVMARRLEKLLTPEEPRRVRLVSSLDAIRIVEAHKWGVHSVALAADDSIGVSASSDVINVWDLTSGRLRRAISGHDGHVTSVAITADGRRLVAGTLGRTTTVFDTGSGVRLHGFRHDAVVNSVAITPDGRRAVSGTFHGTLSIFDLRLDRTLRVVRRDVPAHQESVESVAISADGRLALSGSSDYTIKLWDLDSGRLVHALDGHQYPVSQVAIAADGRLAVSGGRDSTLRVWDLVSGRLLRTKKHDGWVCAVALRGDGQCAVSSGNFDYALKVWDVATDKVLGRVVGDCAMTGLAISTRVVFAGDVNGRVYLWKAPRSDH